MEYKVDYHTHSYFSDGTLSPVELIRKYHDEEYNIVALTDHETVDGFREAEIAGEALKIKVICGIEIPAVYNGIGLHILGYNIDPNNPELLDALKWMKKNRYDRNIRLRDALAKMGYAVDLEELLSKSKNGYVGKPHFAKALVEAGYASSKEEVFNSERFFKASEIRSIKKESLSSEDAIKLILNAKGLPVLAHPVKIRGLGSTATDEYWKNFEAMLKELKKQGLKGLECYYPKNTHEETLEYVKLAGKYYLHITEGSDFHGE